MVLLLDQFILGELDGGQLFAGMPRLLQNTRRSRPPQATAAAAAGSEPTHQTDVELPPYEPLAFPLDDASKRELLEMTNNRDTRKYEQHLVKSLTLLKSAVGATNDRLVYRTTHAEQQTEKRKERGEARKSAAETAAEECVEKLAAEVVSATDKSEAAMREIIDCLAELQDERGVLDEVHRRVQAEHPPRRVPPAGSQRRAPARRDHSGDSDSDGEQGEEDGGDGEGADAGEGEQKPPPPPTGVIELLESVRQEQLDAYTSMSMFQRYSKNNDYISFRRTLHDAQNPDGGALPDPSTWFDQEGNPQGLVQDKEKPANDDEDLIIEREVLSFKCPLTLRTMSEPYTSRVCNHSFEKESILTFLRENRGKSKCPVCPAVSQPPTA